MENSASVVPVAVSNATNPPAPGADDQKPNAAPASDADVQNPEAVTETPEQVEAKRESRRARSNARKAAELASARTEARLLRERVAELSAKDRQSQEAGEPKREDIDPATGQPYDYETYMRRVAKWDAKQEAQGVLKSEREAQQQKERQKQANDGSAKAAKDWSEREKSFEAVTKDYEEVVTAFTGEGGEMESLSRPARMAIVESDVGPALLYFLGKHPEEAERIAELSPTRQIAELGKLEAKVSMPAKKTTNAPAPASTTSGGRTASKDLSKMSQEEYEAARKSQGARWAR